MSTKYDFRVNPVYQVDWQHEQSGKRVAATKRRVRFRFGFSNRQAIEEGQTGTACRGEEHDVVLIWSLTSGKRLVVADGHEIHFSTGKITDNKFETSWSIAGGHIIKVTAHAAPPLKAIPGFRQFDLQIDGLSFFDMPKIFELGNKRSSGRSYSAAPVSPKPPTHFALPPSERRSYHETTNVQKYQAPHAPSTPVFATRRNSAPEFAIRQQASPLAGERHYSAPQIPAYYETTQAPTTPVAALKLVAPESAYQQAVPIKNDFWTQSQLERDEFAPVPPTPPSYADKSSQIMSAYTPSPSLPAIAYTPYYSDYDAASPGAISSDVSEGSSDGEESPAKPIVLKPTMNPISIAEMEEREAEPTDSVSRAMKSLVNLDDITYTLETPEQAKTTRRLQEMKDNDKTKSKPAAPKAPKWHLGAQPSLADIKKQSAPKQPTKEVMRSHAFDPNAAQAGMMVVYGAPNPAGHGFGAGAYPAHYGHHMTIPAHYNRAY